jgi:FkbM family methyltransferase
LNLTKIEIKSRLSITYSITNHYGIKMMSEEIKPLFSIKEVLDVKIPKIEILDIGAMITGKNYYDSLLKEGLGNVTGFEPNPAEFDKLCRENRKNCNWLPYFLGDGTEATFHRTRFPGCSSLYVPDPSVIDLFETIGAGDSRGNFYVTETERVQTKRLDDIDNFPPIDFIKIDVQGSELDIFQNGVETLKNVTVIQTEVEFIPLYKDQPLYGEIQVFLRNQGFQLHKFINVEGRCLRPFHIDQQPYAAMSQTLWADAIFIRDFSKIDRLTDNQLLKAAVIMHELFLSYDLTIFCLMELDRRQGSALYASYKQELQNHPLNRLYMNLKENPN